MTTETKQTAQAAWCMAHSAATATAEAIARELSNMPAPSGMTHWGHVGDVNEIARMLNEVLAQIKGEQR